MLAEDKTVEFKREYADTVKNTVIAFANSDGGTIFIGINDDGSICGVSDYAFKITLPNNNYDRERAKVLTPAVQNVRETVPRERREEAVVALCRQNGFVIRKDVQKVLSVSQPTAVLLLREMVEKGILIKAGAAGGIRYYLNM